MSGFAVVPLNRWRVRGQKQGRRWVWLVSNPYRFGLHIHGSWDDAIVCARRGQSACPSQVRAGHWVIYL